MNKKRLVISSLISITLVAVLLLSSTYSIFTSSDVDEDMNVYTTGNLNITYTLSNKNVQITDITPRTEEEADSVIPYRITVKNTGNVPYKFNLILNDTTTTNVIDYQYIMTKVGYLEAKPLSECNTNIIKEDIILPAGESVDIDIRIWLSDKLQNTEIGKSFYAKLSIDGLAIYNDSTDIDNSILSLRDINISLASAIRNSTYKENITSAAFVDYIDTTNAIETWDLSEDKSIIAWVEEIEGGYNLFIGSNDKIYPKSLANFFNGMSSLENANFDNLDTSLTTDVYMLFRDCTSLTELDVSNLDTSNITNMAYMFYNCTGLTNLDLSNFDTSNVTNMQRMFGGCTDLTTLDASNFNTNNVTNMAYMFYNCTGLTNLDLSNFDTSNVTNMNSMFHDCYSLQNLDLSNFDTSNVTNMQRMFSGCTDLTTLDVSNFNTNNVTNMGFMFYCCESLNELDVSNFDTSNVTDMSYMFSYCVNLTSIDVGSFDTNNVANMFYMFGGNSNLKILDLSNFSTISVTNMGSMFQDCYSLQNLDLSSFDTSNVSNMSKIFEKCYNLNTTITIRNINTTYADMFYNAVTAEGAKITINYTSATSNLVDNMIATKSSNSNVVKGVLINE